MKRTVLVLVPLLVSMLFMPLSPAEESGKSLYEAKCAMCHGEDGVAKKMGKGSADLNDPEWQKATSLETIVEVTAKGEGKMPKYEDKLTPEQIKLIAEYIKTLK